MIAVVSRARRERRLFVFSPRAGLDHPRRMGCGCGWRGSHDEAEGHVDEMIVKAVVSERKEDS